MERIAIYWGAFNMPTIWHRDLIRELSITWKVDRIIFSPDGERYDKKYWVSLDTRMRMLKSFYEALLSDWILVDFEAYFAENNISTSTMDVEDYYKEKFSFQPWHIFWSDTVTSIPNWKWNKEKYLEQVLKKIFVKRKWFEIPDFSWMQNYEFLDLWIREISSSTVKEMLRTKISVAEVLTPEIAEIVLRENLYV